MKAILLGAGRGVNLPAGGPTPKCLLEGLAGWRVLDWILNALRSGGNVDRFVFVGGDSIERIEQAYPDLHYVHNPRWKEEHVLGSLFAAEEELEGPFYFSYSDIVYRSSTVAALHRCPGDIAIVVDRQWRTRYEGRDHSLLEAAEKVVVQNGRVRRIGKDLSLDADTTGEFIGLARFSGRGAASLREAYHTLAPLYRHRPYRGRRNLADGHLTDLLQELIDQGATVEVVEVDGDYAELDIPSDLSQFVFGTKAETLERLRPMLQHANVLDGVHIQVGEWLRNPRAVAVDLAHRFAHERVAVRSSTRSEDAPNASSAGRYHSVIGVDGGNVDAITTAVQEVLESYDRDQKESEERDRDQILVQPALSDVVMSGVLMTRDLETGAPYAVIHYDDSSGRTDSVTSGRGRATETIKIYRGRTRDLADPRLAILLDSIGELEAITGSDSLDIEFAFTADGELHVLQVRPIAARQQWSPCDLVAHGEELERLRRFLTRRMRPWPGLPGRCTIFGQMPDWNPAEMIGAFPQPLARSLYELLITDRAWREGRRRLGYADCPGHALMVELAGRPYVDVRLSANNLLPDTLGPERRGRIVDAGIAMLKARPHLHDKIEFEIWATGFDFDLDRKLQTLVGYGLPTEDVAPYREALRGHTNALIERGLDIIDAQMEQARRLNAESALRLGEEDDEPDLLRKLAEMVELTVQEGTIPFASLARLAFLGTALLRSMVARDVLGSDQVTEMIAAIPTVSSRMVDMLSRVERGELSHEDFLAHYGHLRPGSYNILSPRYDQDPNLYFPRAANRRAEEAHVKQAPKSLPPEQIAGIDMLLEESGLGFGADHLLRFIQRAIAAREQAKFDFSRNLSAMLELLAAFGERHGLSREEMAFLDVRKLLSLAHTPEPPQLSDQLVRMSASARMRRERLAQVLLPGLMTEVEDLELVRQLASRPNFVSSGRVRAPLARLDHSCNLASAAAAKVPETAPGELSEELHEDELAGRVVLIRSADPGYDWIFARRIAGLITCFGGANSHMTIRCAEFGLPAAIGCGDAFFERLSQAHSVELDCGEETIRGLG